MRVFFFFEDLLRVSDGCFFFFLSFFTCQYVGNVFPSLSPILKTKEREKKKKKKKKEARPRDLGILGYRQDRH